MRQRIKLMSRVLTSRFPAESGVLGLRRLKGDCGSDLIEYALVLLLFLGMLFGIAGFGHALYAYHFVSNAAREATRYAAVRGSTCNDDLSCSTATPDVGPAAPGNTVIQDYVATIVPLGIDSKQITVTPTWNPAGSNGPPICATTANATGCTVQVQVQYNFKFIFPLIRTTMVPMSSSSAMVIAH